MNHSIENDELAQFLLEYLYNVTAASRTDIRVIVGYMRTGAQVTNALDRLRFNLLVEERVIRDRKVWGITAKGREYLEKKDEYYGTHKEFFIPLKSNSIAKTVRYRESMSACIGARDPETGDCAIVFRKKKPSFASLLCAIAGEAEKPEDYMKGYVKGFTGKDIPGLLEAGVYYSCAEIRDYLDNHENVFLRTYGIEATSGSDTIYNSRFTGIYLNSDNVYVFYRSEGPMPRFKQTAEEQLMTHLWYWLFYDGYPYAPSLSFKDRKVQNRPIAIMISRTYSLIAPMITEYSRGRIKDVEGFERDEKKKYMGGSKMSFTQRAHANLFNSNVNLFKEIYCIPYSRAGIEDLSHILRHSWTDICEEAYEYFDRDEPVRRSEYMYGPESPINGYNCVKDIPAAYLPYPELKHCRRGIRDAMLASNKFKVEIHTRPKYADELAQSFGPAVHSIIDVDTGKEIEFERYDKYGVKLIPDTRRSDAAKKRWDELEKPDPAYHVAVTFPGICEKELKTMAKKNNTSMSHMIASIIANYMDSEEWPEELRKKRPEGSESIFAVLLHRDEVNRALRRARYNKPRSW